MIPAIDGRWTGYIWDLVVDVPGGYGYLLLRPDGHVIYATVCFGGEIYHLRMEQVFNLADGQSGTTVGGAGAAGGAGTGTVGA